MLNNELYKIESYIPEGNVYNIRLHPDSKIYKAHFPGQPVTPGVCIIEIATKLLELILDKKLSLTEAVNVKFLAIIDPVLTPRVTYIFKKIASTSASELKVSAEVSEGNTIFAKLSLLYKVQ